MGLVGLVGLVGLLGCALLGLGLGLRGVTGTPVLLILLFPNGKTKSIGDFSNKLNNFLQIHFLINTKCSFDDFFIFFIIFF